MGQFRSAIEPQKSFHAALRIRSPAQYLDLMNNEHQFWQDIARTINPGWAVRVDPLSNNPSGTTLAGKDVFIYVVDVANA